MAVILFYEDGSISCEDLAKAEKIGLTTICYRQGAPKPEIMEIGGLQDRASAIGFCMEDEAWSG